MKRVVLTGTGTVNPLGRNVDETLAALAQGRSAIGPLEVRDIDRLAVRIGAAVRDWRAEEHLAQGDLAMLDRFTQFALVAARQAVAQAGLDLAPHAETAGVVIGSAGGGVMTADEAYRAVYAEGRGRVHPFVVPRLMASAPAGRIAIEFGLHGPAYAVASACASGAQAIGQAFQMVRAGLSPVMLAGGADAMLCFGGMKAWESLRVLSETACRPFSAGRDGMVMGEGAAVFVLEERDHALDRGAVILAELAGFAMTADGEDMIQPSARGAARAMRRALEDAGMAPGDVGYVNAHGTGTRANDRAEAEALRAVFGADLPPVSSTKAMHGHLMGATGAVEVLACLLALRQGILPPTMGFLSPDPDCALDVVPNAPRRQEVTAVLSNSFAFGGLNAVLALRRP